MKRTSSQARRAWQLRRIRPALAVRCLLAVALLLVAQAAPGGFAQAAPAGTDSPASADEYAGRVDEALAIAGRALDGAALDGPAAARVAREIRELLPGTETVGSGDQVVTVDNSVLGSMLSRLEAAPDGGERKGILEDISGHLGSIDAAQGIRGRGVPSDPDELARILDETGAGERSSVEQFFGDLVDRLGEALLEWWASVGGSPEAGRTLSTVTMVVLAVLASLLLWAATRAYVRARAATASRPLMAAPAGKAIPVAAAEGLPADALAYADSLARTGDRTGAVRALFGGAARLLADAGVVRQTRTLTNGELVAEVLGASPPLARPLAAIREPFEVAWYGRREPAEEQFEQARAQYVALRDRVAADAGERPGTAATGEAGTDGGGEAR